MEGEATREGGEGEDHQGVEARGRRQERRDQVRAPHEHQIMTARRDVSKTT